MDAVVFLCEAVLFIVVVLFATTIISFPFQLYMDVRSKPKPKPRTDKPFTPGPSLGVNDPFNQVRFDSTLRHTRSPDCADLSKFSYKFLFNSKHAVIGVKLQTKPSEGQRVPRFIFSTVIFRSYDRRTVANVHRNNTVFSSSTYFVNPFDALVSFNKEEDNAPKNEN